MKDSDYKYYMKVCSDCGDDALMMTKDICCPQCCNVDVEIIPNPDYEEK